MPVEERLPRLTALFEWAARSVSLVPIEDWLGLPSLHLLPRHAAAARS
jgi:hypothetical protein